MSNSSCCTVDALQLASGRTRLAFYSNLVSVLILVPLMIALTKWYGAMGTASVWVILNAGYIVIGIHLMHRRLLPTEKWRWYINDVAVPLLSALIITTFWRLLIPGEMSKSAMCIYLTGVSATTLLAAALATSVTRQWINQKIIMLKVLYGR